MDGKLDMNQQCALETQRANSIQGYIKRCVVSRAHMPLCSALVKPHLEYCFQMWCPQYRRNMKLLKHVQRRTTKMIQEVEYLPYEQRLRELRLFSLEKRKLQSDLKAAFLCLKGGYKKEEDRLLVESVVLGLREMISN